jgi:hypothetical protein
VIHAVFSIDVQPFSGRRQKLTILFTQYGPEIRGLVPDVSGFTGSINPKAYSMMR